MAASRFENSFKNIMAAWGGLVFYMLINFINRSVFAQQLSQDYLGLQSLFSSVLTILSLAELGVGSAITYALYKPIAHDDTKQIAIIMAFFRKAYIAIGVVILVLGALLTPFITLIISGTPDINHLHLYFYLFVFNTGISYFFSYKAILITAYQREYVVNIVQYLALGVMSILQIAVLFLTQNYLIFLVVMIVSTVIQNVTLAYLADRSYPFLRQPVHDKLDRETFVSIRNNVGALVLHRVGGIATSPLTTVFISSFVGLGASALYYNYFMIESALERIFDKFFWAITPSMGNFAVLEGRQRAFDMFKTIFFLNAMIYAVVACGYICAVNALIPVWVGAQYLFPLSTTIILAVMIYTYGMRSAEQLFTSAYGLYWQSRYKPVAEFAVFCVLGAIGAQFFGVNGVLLAGLVVRLVIATPIEAYMLFKHGFERSVWFFAKWYVIYAVATVVLIVPTFLLVQILPLEGWALFIASSIIGGAIPFIGFNLIFYRLPACRESRKILMRVVHGIQDRLERKRGSVNTMHELSADGTSINDDNCGAVSNADCDSTQGAQTDALPEERRDISDDIPLAYAERMDRIKQTQLVILDSVVERAFKKLNINYQITYGTLLGAVRHKGYIPWDDDIDLMISVEDYLILVEQHHRVLPSDQFVKSHLLNVNNMISWTCVGLKNTTSMSERHLHNAGDWGICVDIFYKIAFIPEKPVDSRGYRDALSSCQPRLQKLIKEHKRLVQKYSYIYDCHAIYNSAAPRDLLYRAYARWQTRERDDVNIRKSLKIMREIAKLSLQAQEHPEFATRGMWLTIPDYEAIPAADVATSIELEFEGRKLSAPQNWANVLRIFYGEGYMKIPPVEERWNHSAFDDIIIDFERPWTHYLKERWT